MPGPASRANGLRSRKALMERGLALVAQGGRHRVSIGALAAALGMSKSAVHAHFGSKAALEAALVDEAADRFGRAVVDPAGAAPPGLARLAALCDAFLLFAAESGGAGLTPVHRAFGRDLATAAESRRLAWAASWRRTLDQAATGAETAGELARGVEPAQVAYELDALLNGAVHAIETTPPADVVRRTRLAVDRTLLGWSAR
ncbi:MAG: TetR/AcrR family transcriptional regulator [Vicinamibacterales bacterium]